MARSCFRLEIDLREVRRLYVAGNSLQQIAKLLGVHYNTLSSRCSRAGLRFNHNPNGNPTLRPGFCRHGHDLTAEGARDDHGCVECRRHRDREAKRRKAAGQKPRNRNRKTDPTETPPEQRDLTRAILDLHDAWEREMRADLKQELAQQIARMRA